MDICMHYLCKSCADSRIQWHLDVPVCRILIGLKIHLATIGICEIWQLCWHLKCQSIEELTKKMWAMIKAKRKNVNA